MVPSSGHGSTSAGLQPSLFLGDMGCLAAVARAGLLHRDREIVADGAFGERKPGRNLGDAGAVSGGRKHLALALGEGAGAFAERAEGQIRGRRPGARQRPSRRAERL